MIEASRRPAALPGASTLWGAAKRISVDERRTPVESMMTGVLDAISIGLPRTVTFIDEDGAARKSSTGFCKEPTLLPVHVGFTHIDGDGQANLGVHGGADRPILAYCGEHYPRWRAELNDARMVAGAFGENFTIRSQRGSRIDESTVCLGDRFRIGELIVEVSQPREPCQTLTRRWRRPELAKLVVDQHRGGWYFRVIREADVHAGDTIERIANPYPRWSIAAAMDVMRFAASDRNASAELADCPALSDHWKSRLAKHLGQYLGKPLSQPSTEFGQPVPSSSPTHSSSPTTG